MSLGNIMMGVGAGCLLYNCSKKLVFVEDLKWGFGHMPMNIRCHTTIEELKARVNRAIRVDGSHVEAHVKKRNLWEILRGKSSIETTISLCNSPQYLNREVERAQVLRQIECLQTCDKQAQFDRCIPKHTQN